MVDLPEDSEKDKPAEPLKGSRSAMDRTAEATTLKQAT